ncbi:MAG: amino acid ABC transporter permease [Rhizobiales bacterium]|nr:amino acid ABC transporter permease [Hyphomicrobiales bacterium]
MGNAIESLPFLWQGLLVTLEVSFLVVVISLVAGLVLGVGITFGPRWLYWPIRLYSDFIRGIPVLVLIFFVYYGLPALGLNLDNFTAAVAALTIFKTSHVIEIVRGAIQSIHPGQRDAARAIGLTFWQQMAHVIFPQATRRFLPPWINAVTDAVKGSSLVSLIGVVDLMLAIQKVIGRTYEPMPLYITGAIIYFLINYALSSLSRHLETRFAHVREQ